MTIDLITEMTPDLLGREHPQYGFSRGGGGGYVERTILHCTSTLDGSSRVCNKDRGQEGVFIWGSMCLITPQREFLTEFDLNCSDHGNKKSPFHSIFPPGNSLAVSYSMSPTKMSIH